MQYTTPEFEQVLSDNLALYTQPSQQNLFSTNREISYARYALTQQALSYQRAVELLSAFLESAASQEINAKLLTDVMVSINAIEQKSISLIRSVREVTSLLNQAVNIDIDKAALSSFVSRLPSLVRETVNRIDPNLSDKIASSLDVQLSEMMVAFRFNQQTITQSNPQGITFDQYAQLHDSVPNQPN